MKNLNLLTLSTLILLFIAGCKGAAENLDESTATDVIETYLKANPVYEEVKMEVGEIRFKSKNDKLALEKYKTLQEKGWLTLDLQDQKKKFLSKDSVFTYKISLTDKSKPYILKQNVSQATLRALDYVMDAEKPITMIKGDSKVARVTVSLKKEPNYFAIWLKDKGTASNYITKSYKLKYKKDSGWILVGE